MNGGFFNMKNKTIQAIEPAIEPFLNSTMSTKAESLEVTYLVLVVGHTFECGFSQGAGHYITKLCQMRNNCEMFMTKGKESVARFYQLGKPKKNSELSGNLASPEKSGKCRGISTQIDIGQGI